MSIRVLIADDHSILREGLRMVLESADGIEVVGEAGDGRQAVRLAANLNPDVTVLDISMPVLNGIEAAIQMREHNPEAKIIFLSMHSSAEYVFKTLNAGAMGYLLKDSVGKELREAVRSVHAGHRYLCAEIERVVVDGYLAHRDTGRTVDPFEILSAREREILQLVVDGRTSAEIAALLKLSPKTVATYRSRSMQKLGVEEIPSLVKLALAHGMTEANCANRRRELPRVSEDGVR